MIPDEWRDGEVAVVGLGRSGIAATVYLAKNGYRVYTSDSRKDEAMEAAAASLAGPNVSIEIGGHDLERIRCATVVVTSPGVPPSAPPLEAAANAGREIVAELDLGALAVDSANLVVVTGTNGKSTTTALIAHLLKESGVDAVAAGNIGHPLTAVASILPVPEWIVVEASSFQLHFAPHLTPTIGVVTNLSPDHLDWYDTAEDYYADKRNLFQNASEKSVWVLNGDDAKVLELAAGARGDCKHWRMTDTAEAWFSRADGQLMLHGEKLMPRSRLPLLGDHNISNALTAALAATAAGVDKQSLIRGLESFEALQHRLETVRELNGVLWINDSKATNVSSAEVAIQAMTRPFVLILGGRPKGEDYSRLAPLLEDFCHDIVAYGEGRSLMVDALSRHVPLHEVLEFDAAVEMGRSLSKEGGAVLLSPACASFDQFSNFEERGDRFRAIVEAL